MAPGRCVRVLVGAQCVLYSLAWSPDGRQLVASSDDGTVVLFDYGRGMAVKKWRVHAGGGMVLRWLGRSRRRVVAHVPLGRAPACGCSQRLRWRDSGVSAWQALPPCRVAWHPSDPQLIASASADGTVCGFRPGGSEAFCLKHGSGVSGCAFSALQPDLLATTTEAGSVFVWQMAPPAEGEEEGRETRCTLVCTLAGHRCVSRGLQWVLPWQPAGRPNALPALQPPPD